MLGGLYSELRSKIVFDRANKKVKNFIIACFIYDNLYV